MMNARDRATHIVFEAPLVGEQKCPTDETPISWWSSCGAMHQRNVVRNRKREAFYRRTVGDQAASGVDLDQGEQLIERHGMAGLHLYKVVMVDKQLTSKGELIVGLVVDGKPVGKVEWMYAHAKVGRTYGQGKVEQPRV